MAASTGDAGNARGIDERERFARPEDVVFTVAIGANRGVGGPVRNSLAVNALIVGFLDVGMARPAGGRHVPMVRF